MTDRAALVARLRGTPYDKATANCWWLTCLIQREIFGRDLPASPYAGRHERARVLASHPERERWTRVPSPADGDLVLMARVTGQDIHAGVYLAGLGIIHTDDPHGVVVDTALELEHARRWRLSFHRPV